MLKRFFVAVFCLVLHHGVSWGQTKTIAAALGKDAVALLSFVEMSRMGARDLDCKGVPFAVESSDAVIEQEILPVLKKLDGKASGSDIDGIREALKSINKGSSLTSLRTVYDQKKAEAFAAYGKERGCLALSVMFQTVLQQKRLAFKNAVK